jgi:hypothetical protein
MTDPKARHQPFDMRYLGAMAALSLVYFGSAKLGLSLAFATKQVTAVWPPTGVAVVDLNKEP